MESFANDLPNVDKIEKIFKESERNIIEVIDETHKLQQGKRDLEQQQVLENLSSIKVSVINLRIRTDKIFNSLKWTLGLVFVLNIVLLGCIAALTYNIL